jgi:hypothetical protein
MIDQKISKKLLMTVNIEYRLKESMPVKIAGRLTSGRNLFLSSVGKWKL